jgi:hypothetical protein
MTGRADRWIRQTTIGCVTMLALIAGTVSYLHMHVLVALHGQPGWVAALTPLSVDGMIVAASTTLLADSRSGSRGGFLPWALLVIGSVASLAANVVVAEPTTIGRVIAAWPSFALIGSYELLMRQVRRTASVTALSVQGPRCGQPDRDRWRWRSAGSRAGARLAGMCAGRRGSGRWRTQTGLLMGRCPAAWHLRGRASANVAACSTGRQIAAGSTGTAAIL